MSSLWLDLEKLASIEDRGEIRTIILRRVGEFLQDIHRIADAAEKMEEANRKSMYERYAERYSPRGGK